MTSTITKYLKLPFQFDTEKLKSDLDLALKHQWIPHFNKNGYSGDWNSIALYASGGNEKNIFALPGKDNTISPTQIMNACLYFQEVLTHFKCELLTVRLLKLGAGASIKPHRDFNLGYEDNNFRLHIPIITNSEVDFILDDERLEMLPGECWYTNVNYVHSVANRSTVDRVHLVFDGLRNDWSDQLFFSLAAKESFFPINTQEYDEATLIKMIQELEQIEGEGSKVLIAKYKSELATKAN